MTGPTEQQIVAHFLGRAAAAGGPFRLLGLDPTMVTGDRVVSALDARLEQVDAHPDADVAGAEQLRLILQASAAQLLDPTVRRALLQIWSGGGAPPVRPAESAPQPLMDRSVDPGLEHDAILAMAQLGGWNSRSLRRIAVIAHARGLTNEHVAGTLRHMASQRGAVPDVVEPAVREIAPEEEAVVEELEHEATVKRRIGAATVLIVLVFAVVGNLLLVRILVNEYWRNRHVPTVVVVPPDVVPRDPVAPIPSETRTPSAPGAGRAVEEPPALIADPREIILALSGAVRELDDDPESAAASFDLAVRSLGANWVAMGDGHRRAANHEVVEFLFKASAYPDVVGVAVASIGAGASAITPSATPAQAGAVHPAVWSVGMLNRIAGQRELPAAVSMEVRRALSSTLGARTAVQNSSFGAGARVALLRLPLRIITGTAPRSNDDVERAGEAMEAWRDAVVSLLASDRAARQRLLLDGLEQILTEAPEPSDDQRALEAIRTIVAAVDWRSGGLARSRALDWFRARRISNDDLAEVTAALAARSSTDGIDASLVLSRNASRDRRMELRGEYARTWGLEEAAASDELTTLWSGAARSQLARHRDPDRSSGAFEMFARFALLNEVGRRIWRGDTDGASRVIDEATAPDVVSPDKVVGVRGAFQRTSMGIDGTWARDYRAARRNTPVRLDLLERLQSRGQAIGPIDSEIVAEESMFGSPVDVIRPRAQELVVYFGNDPAMVNALLEVLPRRRTIMRSIGDMVEDVSGTSLGDVKDPDWPKRARKALVERLLGMLASSETAAGRLERAVALIASSYERRSGRSNDPDAHPDDPAVAAAETLLDSVRRLGDAMRIEAESLGVVDQAPMSLAEIERLRRGRLELAVGPVQVFAGEQIALAETMAYVLAGENRPRAGRVIEVINDLADKRRAARSIDIQLMETERAMLELWLVRFGEQPSTP